MLTNGSWKYIEEYTKISTPRQEVLFKKGSIGAKKRATPTTSTGTATSNDSGSEQDSVNGNAASPVSPAVGDDPFPYGNQPKMNSYQTNGHEILLFFVCVWLRLVCLLSIDRKCDLYDQPGELAGLEGTGAPPTVPNQELYPSTQLPNCCVN